MGRVSREPRLAEVDVDVDAEAGDGGASETRAGPGVAAVGWSVQRAGLCGPRRVMSVHMLLLLWERAPLMPWTGDCLTDCAWRTMT